MNNTKKPTKRGRPVEHPMPELIPDTPENVARAILNSPPKKRHESENLRETEDKTRAAERRAEIARKAAQTRWAKPTDA